ncbi:hypothetical protein GCM10009675_12720 [Prauserella alba]|uniref:Uncharacterized protein n=1 Tax=Prauserella alba TaxID=176898 RepID=A0ABN1V7Q4_9PSEU
MSGAGSIGHALGRTGVVASVELSVRVTGVGSLHRVLVYSIMGSIVWVLWMAWGTTELVTAVLVTGSSSCGACGFGGRVSTLKSWLYWPTSRRWWVTIVGWRRS